MYREIVETLWAEADSPVAIIVNSERVLDELGAEPSPITGGLEYEGIQVLVDKTQEEFITVAEADDPSIIPFTEDQSVAVAIENGVFFLGAEFEGAMKWIGVPLFDVARVLGAFFIALDEGEDEDAEAE